MTRNQFQEKLLGVQAHLLHFALQLTENRDDARDLLQDTTLRALDNRDKFVSNTSFKSWVFTIMRNIFINHYHKVFRMRTLVERGSNVGCLDVVGERTFGSPDDCLYAKEIREAIHKLEEELKAPFILYVKGYKYVEISEALGLPLGTVKSRIFFARRRLQDVLSEFA